MPRLSYAPLLKKAVVAERAELRPGKEHLFGKTNRL
jgi:hypothetical protein